MSDVPVLSCLSRLGAATAIAGPWRFPALASGHGRV